VQGGVRYVSFFRSGLKVALKALRCANKVQFRRDDVAVGNRRETPIDGEAFKVYQDAVNTVTVETEFVLGVSVYSASSLLSWSEGLFICSPPCFVVRCQYVSWYSVKLCISAPHTTGSPMFGISMLTSFLHHPIDFTNAGYHI